MPRIKDSTLTVQGPFPVLNLPSELRNCIWRYAVVKEEVILYKRKRQELDLKLPESGKWLSSHQKYDDQRRNATTLAVAFACRQLYLEVIPIYYGHNKLCIGTDWRRDSSPGMLQDFTAAIGPRNASSISIIKMKFVSVTATLDLESVPGLKRLEMGLFCPLFLAFDILAFDTSWPSEILAYVRTHPAVVAVRGGMQWNLQDWESFAKSSGATVESGLRNATSRACYTTLHSIFHKNRRPSQTMTFQASACPGFALKIVTASLAPVFSNIARVLWHTFSNTRGPS